MMPAAVKLLECDATWEPVARREFFVRIQIGVAECLLEQDLIAMSHGNDAARLLCHS